MGMIELPRNQQEIDTNDIRLELNGELDPGVLRPQDEGATPGNNYLGVVMPMRI